MFERERTVHGAPEPQAYGTVGLHVMLEPVPNRESRIMLGQDRDLFEQQRIAVNWQLTEAERRNLRRSMELAAIEFGRMGLGRGAGEIFRDPDHWPNNLEAGKHHCGTTRMSDTPPPGRGQQSQGARDRQPVYCGQFRVSDHRVCQSDPDYRRPGAAAE